MTGGAQGIGLGVAAALLAEGASVALLDVNEEQLRVAVETLRRDAPRDAVVAAFRVDVTEAAQVDEAFQKLAAQFEGRVSVQRE